MRKAIEFLKPDGLLVLAAEPVVPARCDILPYEWGPRLDGETMRAIRMLGWMELGFTEGYLFELLRRNGLVFRRISSLETHWADLIVANRAPKVAAGGVYEFATGGIGTKMLAPDGRIGSLGHVVPGPVARVFLDLGDPSISRGATLTFDAMPFLPPSLREQRVVVRAGGARLPNGDSPRPRWRAAGRPRRAKSGSHRAASIPWPGRARLRHRVAALARGRGPFRDSRKLGVALARWREGLIRREWRPPRIAVDRGIHFVRVHEVEELEAHRVAHGRHDRSRKDCGCRAARGGCSSPARSTP